jgi:4-amino-4-deoxy-L-arabinose transferase-like glycosyltransferase
VIGAVAIVALVIGPWLVLVSRQEPAFLRYAFVDETLLRFVSSARFRRGGPVYYYVQMLTWALGVWGVVLAAVGPGLWRRWRAGDADAPAIAFAGRAALAIVLFFTCSASKRPQYILPAMVPLSLLVAAGIAADASRAVAVVRASARWVLAPFAVVVLIAGLTGYRVTHGEFRVVTPSVLTAVAVYLLAWATVVLASRRPVVTVGCCALFAPLLGAALLGPLTSYAEGRSSRALAARIGASDRVVCFESFPTALPFYLQRRIPLVSDTAHELTSNYVIAQRDRLLGREPLLPVTQLADALGTSPAYLLTSTWRVQRLRRLSPSALESVYTGRREVLLRPLS